MSNKNRILYFYCSREPLVFGPNFFLKETGLILIFYVYIKTFRKINCFLYINQNYNYCHQRKAMCTFYTYKNKNVKRFYIQKATHFSKSKTISVSLLYLKGKALYVTQFFKKCLKLASIYKKHNTFRYVAILYTQIQKLSKKQDN